MITPSFLVFFRIFLHALWDFVRRVFFFFFLRSHGRVSTRWKDHGSEELARAVSDHRSEDLARAVSDHGSEALARAVSDHGSKARSSCLLITAQTMLNGVI